MGAASASEITPRAEGGTVRAWLERDVERGAKNVPGMRELGDRLEVGGGVALLNLQRVQGEVSGEVQLAYEDGGERRLFVDGSGVEGRGVAATSRTSESAQEYLEQYDALSALPG